MRDKPFQTQLIHDLTFLEHYKKAIAKIASRVGADEALSEVHRGLDRMMAVIREEIPNAKAPSAHNGKRNKTHNSF